MKKTVTILASNSKGLVATNARERSIWKAKENKDGTTTYTFSHVEDTKPSHSVGEFVEFLAPANINGDKE